MADVHVLDRREPADCVEALNPLAGGIEIVGGGLAGLSLGLALRRAGVPVTLFEAGTYPRQRVCGEFITGLSSQTVTRLGLSPALDDAESHAEVAWFLGSRLRLRQRLPEPARSISREVLDARLAGLFADAGGHLITRARRPTDDGAAGRVIASGRRPSTRPCLGLKTHVRGCALSAGSEIHLGRHGYVGLCRVPGGEVNVCGLFHRNVDAAGPDRWTLFLDYVDRSGLPALADRLSSAEPCSGTEAAVAGLSFATDGKESPGSLRIGDAHGMLPPFFGNGMAAAFLMAADAVDPLVSWARGRVGWDAAAACVRRKINRHVAVRSAVGGALHGIVLSPARQHLLALLARIHCLPHRLLYRALH